MRNNKVIDINRLPEQPKPAPPRMRGIKEAIAELRELDPKNALTESRLRTMLKTKEIPSVMAGSQYLVNLDVLIKHLGGGAELPPPRVMAAKCSRCGDDIWPGTGFYPLETGITCAKCVSNLFRIYQGGTAQ